MVKVVLPPGHLAQSSVTTVVVVKCAVMTLVVSLVTVLLPAGVMRAVELARLPVTEPRTEEELDFSPLDETLDVVVKVVLPPGHLAQSSVTTVVVVKCAVVTLVVSLVTVSLLLGVMLAVELARLTVTEPRTEELGVSPLDETLDDVRLLKGAELKDGVGAVDDVSGTARLLVFLEDPLEDCDGMTIEPEDPAVPEDVVTGNVLLLVDPAAEAEVETVSLLKGAELVSGEGAIPLDATLLSLAG